MSNEQKNEKKTYVPYRTAFNVNFEAFSEAIVRNRSEVEVRAFIAKLRNEEDGRLNLKACTSFILSLRNQLIKHLEEKYPINEGKEPLAKSDELVEQKVDTESKKSTTKKSSTTKSSTKKPDKEPANKEDENVKSNLAKLKG